MQEEKNRQRTDANQPDPQLVNAVATVLQAIQSGVDVPGQPMGRRPVADDEPKQIDLIGLMLHIVEHFWVVLVAAVIGAAVFGYRAGNPVPMYTATSKLYIVDANSANISIADIQLGSIMAQDYQEVFKTWEVHEMVREELGLPYSYAQMQSFLSVSNPEDTHLLYITVQYPDAQMAADIANAYAKAAKEFIVSTMRVDEPSSFSIALIPSTGYMRSKSRDIILGFMVGTVLAIGILALIFILDDRPRTPEDIITYGGIPTLAVLPSTKEVRRHTSRKHRHYKKREGGHGE